MPRQQRANSARGTLVLSGRRCGPLITDPGANWLSKATPGLLDFVGGTGPAVPMPTVPYTAAVTAPGVVTVTWTPPGVPDVVISLEAFNCPAVPSVPTSAIITPGQAILTVSALVASGQNIEYVDQGIANLSGTQSTLASGLVLLS